MVKSGDTVSISTPAQNSTGANTTSVTPGAPGTPINWGCKVVK
jgi:hypothetical protein